MAIRRKYTRGSKQETVQLFVWRREHHSKDLVGMLKRERIYADSTKPGSKPKISSTISSDLIAQETKTAEMRQHYASGLAKSPTETGVKKPPHLCRISWLAHDSFR